MLTAAEQTLIRGHAGSTRCQKLNIGHSFDECPMKATNTWPDATSYVMLTALSRAATQDITKDDETDLYIPPPTVNPPFNIPQLYTTLEVFTIPHLICVDSMDCPRTKDGLFLTGGPAKFPIPSPNVVLGQV